MSDEPKVGGEQPEQTESQNETTGQPMPEQVAGQTQEEAHPASETKPSHLSRKDDPTPVEVRQAVEIKLGHIDLIAQQKLIPLTARQECYKRIVALVKRQLESYYRRYPERSVDERSKDAEDWSIRGIRDILSILDTYDIKYYPNGT